MSYPYQIKSYDEYKAAYKQSVDDPEGFWAKVAENFQWKKKWDKVLEWNFTEPKIEWFKGAKLNITENCIDRHLEKLGDKPAIIWEPNHPDERVRVVTYNRLHKRVCQFAQVLINNGVKKGDRVCIYMGMVPELAYAVLGCARIGAIHSVIFGGFSAQSIADRLYDAQAEFIVTCDGAYRGGKDIPLKSVIDDALIGNRTIKKVIVYTRTRTPVSMLKGRDVWWEDEMEHAEQQLEAPSQPSPGGKELETSRPRHSARPSTYNLIKELSQKHKDNPTEEENILWQQLRANKTGYHIRRQHIIDELIVDFVCLKKNLVIEVDGGYHTIPEQQELDKVRTDYLNSLGFEVMRFSNEAVKYKIDTVVEQLKQKLNSMPDAGKVLPTGKDLGWAAVEMDAEDPLFILYTSGSTGKPKGVVHSCAGYMIWTTYTFVNTFQYNPGDIHFCTADIGWITGHSYILYGPLCAGATSVIFEGIPTWPDAGRFWDIIDRHKVNILYTAPTAIRSLMGFGLDPLQGKDLSSLKILGTVGEPINEEAWHWYDEHIGKKKCPIVDTWWQTETGGCLISNLAGVTPSKPSWATLPMPGVQPVLVDENGKEVTAPSNSPNGGETHSTEADFFEESDKLLYPLLKEFVKTNRGNPTEAEKVLWDQLKGNQLKNYAFRRQHIIGSYITDFVCLAKKLVIEVDGLIHQLPENKITDEQRTLWLNEKGYTLIRFTNEEVLHNLEVVLLSIVKKLEELPFAEKKNYSREASPVGGGLVGAGNLCIKFPWPGMLRTTWGDHERCRLNYFATYENLYFTGDGALKDENGFYRITGRVDDVLNVSGHRIGTAEVENAINMHAGVVESAVVGYSHDIKGQGIYAYVVYGHLHGDEESTRKDVLQTVTRVIGAIAKPDKIQFVTGLPKTRSGKIMRRILRKIAEGEIENLGDISTLLDPGVVEEIKNGKL